MKLVDFPLFFGEIVRLFVEDPDFYNIHIRQGFDPFEWPECDAKTIAINFHHLAESRSVEYAKLYTKKKIENLARYEIPETSEELIPVFHEFKKYGLFKCLALNILRDPTQGEGELKIFQSRPIQSVLTWDLKEHLESRIMEHLKNAENNQEMAIQVPNWPILSELIGGFNPGRVMLFVAGTGVGKTTFSINLALSAIQKFPVLFFNMEMIKQDIIDRIIMAGAHISSRQWNSPTAIDTQSLGAFVSKVYGNHNLVLTDGRALSLDQIESEIYRQCTKNNPKLIIIDYDQKIKTKFQGDEWQTVLKAVERLEEVAKTTNTFIMILAQGNENNDPKASKRSMQPASIVLSFHKDPEHGYVLEAKKNRFGPKGVKISVDCDFETFTIKENAQVIEKPMEKRPLDSSIYQVKRPKNNYVD